MRERLIWFYWLLILVMGILGVRLSYLQIFEAKYYRVLADENRIKLKILAAERGDIVDRFGEVLEPNEANAPVIGYAGEADEKEAEKFYLKARVGKIGLQKQYDQQLRGTDGVSILEQDAKGKEIRELKRIEPIKGQNLKLTIDSGLQKKAYEILNKRKGAVVISDVKTGGILALVSSPSFDPKKPERFLDDKNLPMFNRAISGEYPPGSTFKIITATAALEEGKIDKNTLIEDTGEIRAGGSRFGNWYFSQYGRTEGFINIVKALARSNDIFFYRLGEKLGIGRLADWAKYFGLNERTGIDLQGEASGLMPDEKWKEAIFKEQWYLGDTYISAIGQGNILTTPIQINQMMSTIANRGILCQPFLVSGQNCKKLDISEPTLNLVTEGLKQVCETGGTAWPFFEFKVKDKPVEMAGKTGTAEFGPSHSSSGQALQMMTHAWFTGFTPVNQPQIVVTVLLEGAGEGSYQAAPVAKKILQYWLERQ